MPTGMEGAMDDGSSVTFRCSGEVTVSTLAADLVLDSNESRKERPVGLAYSESRGEKAKEPLLLLPPLLPGRLLVHWLSMLGADSGPDMESSYGDEVWMEIGWRRFDESASAVIYR
jgi:hypothetical protein